MADILPVPYYHFIFTLPHLVHPLLQYNKRLIYDLLFSSAAHTLLNFGRDPKWLGGEIGFYGILHTWGQTLWPHPHLHLLVPGGALTSDNRWVTASHRGRFLFPVHALSKVFKGKFIEALKEAHTQESLSLPADMQYLAKQSEFERWLNRFAARNWVVYCKSPLKDAEQVVRYIGRYTHRVAISNSRILGVKEGQVVFKYKDYKAHRVTWKTMRLDIQEFIRRFLWHVLPPGFHKIRHFGFLANGRRKKFIPLIQGLFNVAHGEVKEEKVDVLRFPCPACKKGSLFPRLVITRYSRTIMKLASFFKDGSGGYAYDST